MIDLGFVEKLLELLNRSNAHSIEVRRWWTTVKISKGDVAAAAPAPTPSIPSIPSVPSTPSPAPPAEAPAEAPKPNLTEIKSPMVGTFYAQPEPGADPYVRVGSRITVGQTLCIIEAMKIMNPLDAELAGVVREIAVQDAQPVEFGQVLFRVDPNG